MTDKSHIVLEVGDGLRVVTTESGWISPLGLDWKNLCTAR